MGGKKSWVKKIGKKKWGKKSEKTRVKKIMISIFVYLSIFCKDYV